MKVLWQAEYYGKRKVLLKAEGTTESYRGYQGAEVRLFYGIGRIQDFAADVAEGFLERPDEHLAGYPWVGHQGGERYREISVGAGCTRVDCVEVRMEFMDVRTDLPVSRHHS